MLQKKINDLNKAIDVLKGGGHDYAASVLEVRLRELKIQISYQRK